MTKDGLKKIINKHVGYAEADIYDAIDEYEAAIREQDKKEIQKLNLQLMMKENEIWNMYEKAKLLGPEYDV